MCELLDLLCRLVLCCCTNPDEEDKSSNARKEQSRERRNTMHSPGEEQSSPPTTALSTLRSYWIQRPKNTLLGPLSTIREDYTMNGTPAPGII
jgi:hypothetical protein